ncbi:hypothetical protein Slin15195_G105500 [Septoria linicola]|uniref:Uncharacterized protein n=1 Tax=Septoria linicola TaxID=215465 RepID=A0A9Q9B4Y3_9PEZI|nr:hypothetical protein Slin15195_G105500 [Septoria linicola]
MAQALGFLLSGASLVPFAVDVFKPKPSVGTSVQIFTGSGKGSQADGNVPHIALWDDNGNRLGQYHAGKKERIKEGSSKTIMVEHNQNGGEAANPYYIMLSNLENDAICISTITVANEIISASFSGDTGYMCGQSWFLSEAPIGSNYAKPRCVWLDGDHSNGLNARAMSFHLNDFAPNNDKLTQYLNEPDTLCKSTPRFSIWGNLLPDGIIPFFEPKLEYNLDSVDGSEGNDTDTSLVIDKEGQYNKAVYLHQGEKTKRSSKKTRNTNSRGSNKDPEHLIITDQVGDDVREVCESQTSYGWDIVSTVQKLFCDMQEKQLYQLCDGEDVKDNCFDLEARTIVPRAGVAARDEVAATIPKKKYTSQSHWRA